MRVGHPITEVSLFAVGDLIDHVAAIVETFADLRGQLWRSDEFEHFRSRRVQPLIAQRHVRLIGECL